jgi:hypothetical protein
MAYKHEIFFSFIAETESSWSQGHVTRNCENRIRLGRDMCFLNISALDECAVNRFRVGSASDQVVFCVCSAIDEIRSAYAQLILNDCFEKLRAKKEYISRNKTS